MRFGAVMKGAIMGYGLLCGSSPMGSRNLQVSDYDCNIAGLQAGAFSSHPE
jgi:hypothetical protein